MIQHSMWKWFFFCILPWPWRVPMLQYVCTLLHTYQRSNDVECCSTLTNQVVTALATTKRSSSGAVSLQLSAVEMPSLPSLRPLQCKHIEQMVTSLLNKMLGENVMVLFLGKNHCPYILVALMTFTMAIANAQVYLWQRFRMSHHTKTH